MNQQQKTFAISQITAKAVAQLQTRVDDYISEQEKAHAKCKLTVADFLQIMPALKAPTEIDVTASITLDNIFDLSKLEAIRKQREEEVLSKYPKVTPYTAGLCLYNPQTRKTITVYSQTHKNLTALKGVCQELQAKLDEAASSIMLGDSEEARAIIASF